IQSEQLKDLSKFDYFTIKYKVSGNVASLGLQGMQGSTYNRAVDTVTDNDGWIYATWRKDNQKAINNSISDPQGADVFDYIEKNGSIEICLYVGADVTLTVAEITGGYDDIVSDGTAIDLTKELALEEEEFTATFTPTGGAAQNVTNKSAFQPTERGVLTLEIEKQGYGLTQTAVNVKKSLQYGTYPTNKKSDFASVSATNGTAALEVEEVTEGEYTALKVVMSKQYPKLTFKSEELKALAQFDYFTVRYKVTYSASGGNLGITGTGTNASYFNTASTEVTEDGWTIGTWRKDETNYNNKGQKIFEYIKTNGILEFSINAWNGDTTTTTLIVAEIIGGYDDLMSDCESPIDLTIQYALAADEFTATFTPTGGTAQNVVDEAAFVPTGNGTLTLDIKKAGYWQTSLSVNVKKAFAYGVYPTNKKSDFTSVGASVYGTPIEVSEITEGEYPAFRTIMTKQYPKLTLQSEALKDLASFDYFTIRYKISYSASGGNVGIKGTTGDVYNRATSTTTDDGWTVATWRKDDTHNNIGKNVFDYIKNNGILEICINAWNGANTTTTLTVAEIIGGYDDVTYSGTAIDITSQFGLAAGEFTATFTPTGESAQAVSDVTAFVPSKNGVLTLNVDKAGCCKTKLEINVTVPTSLSLLLRRVVNKFSIG
ncbi:MAG: hypothetical protein IJE60_02520, partial [Tyzzerella sp.]|nr:hypothetical protein [Tyzzerella sp.]